MRRKREWFKCRLRSPSGTKLEQYRKQQLFKGSVREKLKVLKDNNIRMEPLGRNAQRCLCYYFFFCFYLKF